MTTTLGRRSSVDILYNRISISPHIKTGTYTDNLSGQADEISLVIEDREQYWTGKWAPRKGSTLSAALILANWGENKSTKRSLGTFEIDEIEVVSMPSEATIKAISIPSSSSIRGEGKNTAWEKATLKKVGQDIAKRNKLKLHFELSENPHYDRVEQAGESDVKFLMRLCEEAGAALKVSNSHIVILDEADYEANEAKVTILKSDKRIQHYSGRSTLNGIYRACKVIYEDPKTKKTISYTFVPPKAPKVGRTLIVNEEVKSHDQAKKLAKNRLRNENKNAETMTLTFTGADFFYAGMTLKLSGFGMFNGKYIITQAHVSWGGRTESILSLRKCLEGY